MPITYPIIDSCVENMQRLAEAEQSVALGLFGRNVDRKRACIKHAQVKSNYTRRVLIDVFLNFNV